MKSRISIGLLVFSTLILVGVAGTILWNRWQRVTMTKPSRPRQGDTEARVFAPLPDDEPIASVPLRQRTAGTLFTELSAEETGVTFVNTLGLDKLWSDDFRHALHGSSGAGTCVGDYDNDGRPDLYLVSKTGGSKLFRQVGDFRFEDVTESAGVRGEEGVGSGATFVDIDNDEDLDLYVCKYDAPNLLYINQGDGTFIESAKEFGLDYRGASVMAAFSDYDRDGDLDLYLLTNRLFPSDRTMGKARSRVKIVDGRPVVPREFEEVIYFYEHQDESGKSVFTAFKAGQRDYLFRNNGNGSFTDVTDQAGVGRCFRGHSATWWDFNEDGWPDLYVANDFHDPDHLYRNNRDGSFTDITKSALPHTPWFSMGSDSADINNDGHFDLLASDMSATTHFKQKVNMAMMSDAEWFLESAEPRQYMRNALFLNTGTDRFMEVAYLTGLDSTDWTWAVKFCDMDNDGWTDVLFANGMIRNIMDGDLKDNITRAGGVNNPRALGTVLQDSQPLREANVVYRNLGNLQFQEMSGPWGLAHKGISYSAVFADLDRDGDQDLVVNNLNEPVSIYRNQLIQGHSILIRLRGTRSNRYGIGSILKLETASGIQARRLALARGYMSSEEPLVHFGLGEDELARKLTVRWPSGHIQEFTSLRADRLYIITEPRHEASFALSEPETRPAMFQNVTDSSRLRFRHIEQPFDDFRIQPLLPYKLSRLGPGLAWGDADGDGDDDLFVGGAAGQRGRLHIHNNDGRFTLKAGPWNDDGDAEDMSVLWLDIDGDGDLDLYVASGGVECAAGDRLLRDRLYLNDGKGNFRKAQHDALPNVRESTGAVAAADFDGDGDLDLFVGSRVIPGQYPKTPSSSLLRNEKGRFVDVTEDLAPGLRKVGLVTGALWSDTDDDGRPDLLVTLEWGPVKLFRNRGGKLEDHTQQAHLDDYLGWWNSIAGGDIDGDQDIDYVVTNVGLNTKYHASPERPALLYYGDFEDQGRRRLVEACYEGGIRYPIRGRSCTSEAMPLIAKKFATFRSFAVAELNAIYTPERLQHADVFTANYLQSAVLVNLGDQGFAVRPLPRLAQAAPGFGVLVADLDADGHNDVYLVQNFFAPQPETGHMDGGLSLLLKGDGAGGLLPVGPSESGLLVSGDAKALAACDLNQDGWPDLAVTRNNQSLMLFEHNGVAGRKPLAIRLQGMPGNPTAVGARVTVRRSNGQQQTAEVYAGAGYLSQSAPVLFFGRDADSGEVDVTIRWPDATDSTHRVEGADNYVVLAHPDYEP